MKKPYKVLLRRCDKYDPDQIANIVKEGMEELGIKPFGKILMKPNAVIAHKEIFPYAFTRKEFLDGVIIAIKKQAENVTEIAVGERSGLSIPTRFAFIQAGYPEVIRKHKIKTYYFDEEKHIPVKLNHPDALRKQIFMPKPTTETDFLINLPKFKAHPWSRLTLSLKNFIGLQDDRHRLVDHNQYLEHKIADLQEAIQPKFIAIDAIVAGEKLMLTPDPFPMGVIVMGANSCAVDTVGCHMVNVAPDQLIHLKYSSERGFGPMSLDDIEIGGDYPLDELQEKNKNFQINMERIDKYFTNGSNLKCTVGSFPENHSKDYCWGGCPGALREAIHIIEAYQPTVLKDMKKVRYVVGKVQGNLELAEDEKVIFAGDCTSYNGKINGEKINIKSNYKSTEKVDETKTPSNDLMKKTFQALSLLIKNKNKRYIQVRGCPIDVSNHIHYLSGFGGFKNVNFDTKMSIGINIAYWKMRFHRFFNSLK
ncbi:MAG: DUF362 domain-containing protein [Cyclobacteriaceae bacterium]|nr:DUF362 domain-containing protein [Cyclobacteriaceae bacterium]